ncbi:uncharacterized protein CG42266 [Drosophila rhopaloa]|uniref:Uncharacterized protein n=1 Tax=Drosophila rhopaloa TaxID=1041015 RepID=A0ABM5HIX3_DRORH|nr:uncharacterized protein CG42266 [Drosophila rhopaloa]
MFCDEPAPEPEKIICRCKNCVLRHSDILPWPEPLGVMAEQDGNKDGTASRRMSTRTVLSVDSEYPTRDGDDKQNKDYTPNRYDATAPGSPVREIIHEGYTPNLRGANSTERFGDNTPMRVPTQAPAQPTILLIVVNKNDPPPFPDRGYPGAGAGRGYHGQGPVPRGFPGQGRCPPNYYPPPPSGPSTRPRPRPNYGQEHFRCDNRRFSDDYRNNRFGYYDDWRRQPRRYSNNVYADQPRIYRHPEARRDCRCPNVEKSQPGSPPNKMDTDYPNDDFLQTFGNKANKNRLVGSGNGKGHSCHCKGSDSMRPPRNEPENERDEEMGTPHNTMENFLEMESPEEMQEVIVTDAKNKAYKCIQVPICISTGETNTCRCCRCAQESPDADEEEFDDEEAECICNPQGKCTCVPGQMFQDDFGCECDLTNLERTLRDLIPNADCICYLKKKRRKRRKKWAPKVYYDRFANPPFVLNPKPRCLEYGRSPYCNPCYNPCCCAPLAKSCYTCDYGCGGCCRC